MRNVVKLIILEQGNILVSDEKSKSNDLVLINSEYYKNEIRIFTEAFGKIDQNICQKIIASDNSKYNLPRIDYNGLEEKFGIVDVEKFAYDKFPDDGKHKNRDWQAIGFIKGFKHAQSLNDKKFSLVDIEHLARILTSSNYTDEFRVSAAKKYIQSIQPKIFDVEVEMEITPTSIHSGFNMGNMSSDFKLEPKITNNSIKITKNL